MSELSEMTVTLEYSGKRKSVINLLEGAIEQGYIRDVQIHSEQGGTDE